MKNKHEVGSLIRKGLSVQEIQERIKGFPDNPDIEYFMSLGYAKNTAREYRYQIRKNSNNCSNSKNNNLIMSKNANKSYLILDTSALTSPCSGKFIKDASSITILYSVIKEFDTAPKKENASPYFKHMIRNQTKEILLLENEKYRLVPFGRNINNYTDEVLLDYLFSLPINERPTLLTCDNNLALKAKCLGFEFILCSVTLKNKKEDTIATTSNEPQKLQKAKKDTLNINLLYEDLLNVKKHNPNSLIFFVKNDNCNKILEIPDSGSIDYCCIITKSYGKNLIKVKKYYAQNNQKATIKFKCYCEENIEQLENELHPIVLDCIKNLLYQKEEPC